MKQLLIALLCIASASANDLIINHQGLFVPEKLGSLAVSRTNQGFKVLKDRTRQLVNHYNVDPVLKNLDQQKLAQFIKTGAGYVAVSQLDNGEYLLKAKTRGLGGGPLGSAIGFWAAKTAVYVVGHGTIIVASALTGPGALATFASLEGQFAPAIEAVSNTAALAGGIAGGAGTPL